MRYEGALREFRREHLRIATEKWRAAMLQVMAGTILDTPVLDGYLRGGWTVSLDSYGPGNTAPDMGGAIAISLAQGQVASAELTNTVYFVNRYSYAYKIEYEGWSHTKAPEGMWRRNLVRWPQIMDAMR